MSHKYLDLDGLQATLQAVAKYSDRPGPFLYVDEGRLVACGVWPYLAKGLSPVLFRCLRRHNKTTVPEDEELSADEHITRRWTQFSKLPGAVAVDPESGVVSWRENLFSGDPEQDKNPMTTDPSALILFGSTIRYGRNLMDLSDTPEMRMLNLPFILGFADLSEDYSANLITLADTAVRLPFRVRYTPRFEYEDNGLVQVQHHFGFDLK